MAVIEKEALTKLESWGTSQGVRIPKTMCDYLLIGAGSDLEMSAGRDERGRFITLRVPDDPHRLFSTVPITSMDEAFGDYAGDYVPTETDWGEDLGAEAVV